MWSGVHTGMCITGDADCDGDPSSAGVDLTAADSFAVDSPAFDQGEFVAILLDFGNNPLAHSAVPWYTNPALAVVGVPCGPENLGRVRVAALQGHPRQGFGTTVPNVDVSVFNYANASATFIGPSARHKHLELTLVGFSGIPRFLAGRNSSASVRAWDPAAPCVFVSAIMGSSDDGPIGEDSVSEQGNVCASASASASNTMTPSPPRMTRSHTRAASRSRAVSASRSHTRAPSRSRAVSAPRSRTQSKSHTQQLQTKSRTRSRIR